MSDSYIGEIKAFPYKFAPRNWSLCNGTKLKIQENLGLYSVIGITYGGDGREYFNLPNFTPLSKGAIGQGRGPGLSDRTMGEARGDPVVSLSDNTMAAHNHALLADQEIGTTNEPANNFIAGHPSGYSMKSPNPDSTLDALSLKSSGDGQPHNNRQPFLQMNYFIATTGIYP